MKAYLILGTVLLLTLVACGGDEDDSSPGTAASVEDSGDSETLEATEPTDDNEVADKVGDSGTDGARVVNVQPAGQAMVSVEGNDFTLTEPGGLACTVAGDSVTFSFRLGDNEITLGGGANRTGDDWIGGLDLRVANPVGEPGPITYFNELPMNSAGMAVNGASFSYSGPMLKQLANDGSNPLPVDVGDGVISLTCP